MNIDSVNLVSKSPAPKAIEGDGLSLPENGAMPEDFANALKSQKKLLRETNGQAELPGQLQTIAIQPNTSDLLKNTDDQKELVALLEKYLPLANTEKADNPADISASLLTSTDGQTAIAPSALPIDVTATQDMSSAMAFNGLTFVKSMPEEVKLTISGDNRAPVVSLQAETVVSQPIQNEQAFNFQAVDISEPGKQAQTPENQFSLTGLEKATPEMTADMLTIHTPIDNNRVVDSPTITKPLTHPGWSKDLGEQIIWMNNKEISAAEIKLNPDHLGPISIRIDVNQDNQTSILFTAQHPETKEAIETSIPKLREMLLGQQLNLVNVNISQNSTPDHQGRPQSQPFYKSSGNHEQNIESLANALETNEPGQAVNKGLLSLYA